MRGKALVLAAAVLGACALAPSNDMSGPSNGGNPTVFIEGKNIYPQHVLLQPRGWDEKWISYAFFDEGVSAEGKGGIYIRAFVGKSSAMVTPVEYSKWQTISFIRTRTEAEREELKRRGLDDGFPAVIYFEDHTYDPDRRGPKDPLSVGDDVKWELIARSGGQSCLGDSGSQKSLPTLTVSVHTTVQKADATTEIKVRKIIQDARLVPPDFDRERCARM